jgi:Zn-dependent metalloprotease
MSLSPIDTRHAAVQSCSYSLPVTGSFPERVEQDTGFKHTCYIVPPYISDTLSAQPSQEAEEPVSHDVMGSFHKKALEWQAIMDAHFRDVRANMFHLLTSRHEIPLITVFDSHNTKKLPGDLVLSNEAAQQKTAKLKADKDAQLAFQGAKKTYAFYLEVFKRNSFDAHGGPLYSTVNYGKDYDNAFFNGRQMIYGDGDNKYFDGFVKYYDVQAHELTHGVTGNRLDYKDESGALNEHISDVFGALANQYSQKLSASAADAAGAWVIGNGLLRDPKTGKSYPIRSMSAPGTAYDFKPIGKDPQPALYPDLYKGKEDDGGVHINSGVPNRAFYLFSIAMGGNAWETPGQIWYRTLTTDGILRPNAKMKDFALATLKVAKILHPNDSDIQGKLTDAWKKVQVIA